MLRTLSMFGAALLVACSIPVAADLSDLGLNNMKREPLDFSFAFSCENTLQENFDWVTQDPSQHHVAVSVTKNTKNATSEWFFSKYIKYPSSVEPLQYHEVWIPDAFTNEKIIFFKSFTGQMDRFISEKAYYHKWPTCESAGNQFPPLNPHVNDGPFETSCWVERPFANVTRPPSTIDVRLNPNNHDYGIVRIDTEQTAVINASCSGSYMYGFADGDMYTITFKRYSGDNLP